jgi:oligopeptide transport system ATP-binding protein
MECEVGKMSPRPVLDVQDLHLSIGSRGLTGHALRGVSLSCNEGEVLALVGESGSGKSLTARSIVGDFPRGTSEVRGSVLLEGADVMQMSEDELRAVRGSKVAMIFQDPLGSLNPAFRVGSQLVASIRRHTGAGSSEAKRMAIGLLEEMEIADAERRFYNYPHQLSGGMRQRVVAAIALSGSPSLLIADEPTTALDVTVEAAFLGLLERQRRTRNLAVLFITHDLSIVRAFADRVAVMYAGRVVESGHVAEVFDTPSHPYTSALIQSIPRLDDLTSEISTIPGRPPSIFTSDDGCRFRERCQRFAALGGPSSCVLEDPTEVLLGAGRGVACHHHATDAEPIPAREGKGA